MLIISDKRLLPFILIAQGISPALASDVLGSPEKLKVYPTFSKCLAALKAQRAEDLGTAARTSEVDGVTSNSVPQVSAIERRGTTASYSFAMQHVSIGPKRENSLPWSARSASFTDRECRGRNLFISKGHSALVRDPEPPPPPPEPAPEPAPLPSVPTAISQSLPVRLKTYESAKQCMAAHRALRRDALGFKLKREKDGSLHYTYTPKVSEIITDSSGITSFMIIWASSVTGPGISQSGGYNSVTYLCDGSVLWRSDGRG